MDYNKAYIGDKVPDFAFLGAMQIYPRDAFPTPTPTPTITPTPTPTPTMTPSPTPTFCPATASTTSASRVGNLISFQGSAYTCVQRGFVYSSYPDFSIKGVFVAAGSGPGTMSGQTTWGGSYPVYVRAFSSQYLSILNPSSIIVYGGTIVVN